MNAPQHFATIWRADSPLARCVNCGAMNQFHGRPNFSCTAFQAETIDDIAAQDLRITDAYPAFVLARAERDICRGIDDDLAAKHDERAGELLEHLITEIEGATGLTFEQLHEVLA